MRIFDENNNEILESDVDRAIGYVTEETINTVYHDAIEETPEQSHYIVVAEYENGGQDVEKVIDVPYQQAKDAYWETEDILRYKLFTDDELKERLNRQKDAFRLEAQTLYTAMMTDTLLEE